MHRGTKYLSAPAAVADTINSMILSMRSDKAGKLISDGGRSFTSINNSGFGRFLNLKIAYRLSAESEIAGSFDFVRTAPQGRATHSFIGGISGTSDEEWKITYLPVSIIFQHHFTGISRKIVPSVGVGTSISVLNVAARQTFNSALDDDLKITNETNSQVKFGVNAFLDLQGTITDKLFVTTRLQAHYIPEMDLYDRTNNANYTIDLSGMNITAGLGIRW